MEEVQKQEIELNSNDGNLGADGDEKKQPFVIRAIKKLISWTITIVICVFVGNYIIGLQAEQKQDFFADAKRQAEDEALAKFEKLVQVEVPESFVQDEVEFMRRTIEEDCKMKNISFEDFLKARETTLEKLYKEWEPDARKRVVIRLGLLELAKQANIEVTEKDLEEACKGHSHEHKKEDEIRHKNMVAAQIRIKKSIDHLLEPASK